MTISLITVCYNSAAVIRTALESVLRQTHSDIDYIVVDGGSTDGTVEILREYEERFEGEKEGFKGSKVQRFKSGFKGEESTATIDQNVGGKRMRWVSEKDDGMYDAINKGIRMATGEVVGLLNADDVLEDDRVVERIAQEFLVNRNTKIDGVYGDVRFVKNCVNEEGKEKILFGHKEHKKHREGVGQPKVSRERANDLAALRKAKTVRYYSARHWRPWMLRWGFMPPHPSVYIRREWFERLGFYKTDYQIAADYELLIRYLWKARLKTAYLPGCLVTMRMGGKSTKGWRSNLLLNREIVRGNRENGVYTNLAMLVPKYAFKVWEFWGRK
jgi:glycosyltransferase involved in cell wall biosynthesis